MNAGTAQVALASSHAAVHVAPLAAEDDPDTYLTDESGLLLTDPEGNLITEG